MMTRQDRWEAGRIYQPLLGRNGKIRAEWTGSDGIELRLSEYV
jgi:hypothetical protein